MRVWIVAWIALSVTTLAHADPDAVALLPLDAKGGLDIYGQPVANEIARALKGDSLDVVVVGAKESVPERVRLIIDGKIAKGAGSSIVLSLRIRNPKDGKVLDEISEPAPSIAKIDRAAAALSARLVPAVQQQLRALATEAPPKVETLRSQPPPSAQPPPARLPLLVAIAASSAAAIEVEPLRATLVEAVATWTRAHSREPRTVDASTLGRRLAPQTVANSGVDRAIAFEVLGYDVRQFSKNKKKVPMARARVRVRIADGQTVLFDRVVVTDSIVGAPATAPAELAARTAREVLSILAPHIQRTVPAWP